MTINGRRCLVIQIDDHVEVNGITVYRGVEDSEEAPEESEE